MKSRGTPKESQTLEGLQGEEALGRSFFIVFLAYHIRVFYATCQSCLCLLLEALGREKDRGHPSRAAATGDLRAEV